MNKIYCKSKLNRMTAKGFPAANPYKLHDPMARIKPYDPPRAMLSLRLHGYSLILSAVAAASVLRAAVASFMATSSSRQKVSHPTYIIQTHTHLYAFEAE